MGKARESQLTEAAAAAVVTGAAVVGGKLAEDKLSDKRAAERARAYRLRRGETVPDGMRRIGRGQLEAGIEELDGQPNRKLDEAVHSTRKRLKRLRAALRVERGAIGDGTYRLENTIFRDAGRRLSGPRDAAVLIEILDGLTERFGDELPAEDVSPLRNRLVQEHKRAVAKLRRDEKTLADVRGVLEDAHVRTAARDYGTDGFDVLGPGLRRIYRRGRRAMQAAREEQTNEHMHEWRKRAKDLWHAAQILRPASPKRMKALAKQAHELSDLLGDDHDLAVLHERVEKTGVAFEQPSTRRALLAVIDRRRGALQREALELGAKIYDRSPRRFVRSIERRWRKRVARRTRPVAA
jgi:CHAD domain-containing protein